MKLIFLGSGTSQGVPMLGCDCYVCRSNNPKNKRLRASVLIKTDSEKNILIDCGTDFRQQALRIGLQSLNAVLLTHSHADHVFGLDDIRPFNNKQKQSIPIYLSEYTLKKLKQTYHYAFDPDTQIGGGLPQYLIDVFDHDFKVDDILFQPILVKHGRENVWGFRFNDLAYITDCKSIPEGSLSKLYGLNTLIVSAIWFRKHETHMNIQEALQLLQKLKPKKTYFTHITHHLDHDLVQSILPENVYLAYDGLELEV